MFVCAWSVCECKRVWDVKPCSYGGWGVDDSSTTTNPWQWNTVLAPCPRSTEVLVDGCEGRGDWLALLERILMYLSPSLWKQ